MCFNDCRVVLICDNKIGKLNYILVARCCFFFVSGAVLYILDVCDWFLYKASPFCAIGVTLVSVYWTLVTYGAISVMQVRSCVCLCKWQFNSRC